MTFNSKFVASALSLQLLGSIAQIHGLQQGPDEPPVTPTATTETTPQPQKTTQYREPVNFAEDISARLMGRPGKVPVAASSDNSSSLVEREEKVLSWFAEPMRSGFQYDARAQNELKREGFKDVEITSGTSSFTNIMTCGLAAGFIYPTSLPPQGLGFKAEAPDGSQVEGTVCFGVAKKPLPVIGKTLRGPMA